MAKCLKAISRKVGLIYGNQDMVDKIREILRAGFLEITFISLSLSLVLPARQICLFNLMKPGVCFSSRETR